jgi:hemerythrin superfamily protein
MKATDLLKKDHQKVKGLIKQLLSAKENRMDFLDTIEEEIQIHSQCEEQVFYPAVKEIDAEMVEEATEEHHKVDAILAELKEMTAQQGEQFTAKVKELEENLEHHMEEEEGEMFPRAEKELKAQLEDLGDQIENLKKGLSPEERKIA